LEALTRPSERLPIRAADSTFYDADRVGDSGTIPLGNAAVFSLLEPLVGELDSDNETFPFEKLCRAASNNKDSCEPDVGRLLYQLTRFTRPQKLIEVGVFVGAASCHLALAMHRNANGAELHLVDVSSKCLETAGNNLRDFGLCDNVFFHCGHSADVAQTGNLPIADLIFLDGDHRRECVGRDLECYWNLVREGGFLILHDSILWNGVRYYANQLTRALPDSVFTFATSGGSGISIIRKPADFDFSQFSAGTL
jgi:predicted O-methyltransferase YrrM